MRQQVEDGTDKWDALRNGKPSNFTKSFDNLDDTSIAYCDTKHSNAHIIDPTRWLQLSENGKAKL